MKEPNAAIIAMINDLSTEALASLLCLDSYIEAKIRQLILDEYRLGNIEASVITDTWEVDDD